MSIVFILYQHAGHASTISIGSSVYSRQLTPVNTCQKINITVSRLLLSRIDDYAKSHGAPRSGFLVQAARQAMAA